MCDQWNEQSKADAKAKQDAHIAQAQTGRVNKSLNNDQQSRIAKIYEMSRKNNEQNLDLARAIRIYEEHPEFAQLLELAELLAKLGV